MFGDFGGVFPGVPQVGLVYCEATVVEVAMKSEGLQALYILASPLQYW